MHVLSKQAIYDKHKNVAFWEVFLQDKKTGRYPQNLDPLKATSIAVDLLVELGIYKIGGGRLVFVNVPAIFLEASMFDLIPPEQVGIELVENKSITNQTYEAINILLRRGFKFCIDDFGFERIDYLPILNKAHFVKIDIKNSPYDLLELKEVIAIVKSLKKGAIAKNIETEEDYKTARELGFDYFQGNYLSPPVPLKDTRIIAYLKGTLFNLYKALKEGNLKQVDDILEKDVGAAYKLLKFASGIKKISTLEEAIDHLGFDNMVKFAIIIALSEMFPKGEEKEYWQKALYRASLSEKLAEMYAPSLKGKAHLVGLFSLSWQIFGQDPKDVTSELGLDKDIQDAFERKPNELSFILSLVELMEEAVDNKVIEKVAKILGISPEKVQSAIENAKEESKAIVGEFS
ncbi:EAL and HDOD domain-containing protein [Thermocrinis sp.]